MRNQTLGYAEGWISIVLNTALFAAKLWVGTLCGSVAMIADAWHTLSDTLTSAVVIVGFRVSARPADGQHPFGHGRAEPVAGIVIGTLLAVVALFFLRESVSKLAHPERFPAARFGALAVSVFLASVVLKEGLARFSIWAGRRISSSALVADGWHHRSDAVASALIVAGGLFAGRFWWMDGVLGTGVSLLVAYAAYDIIRSATSVTLGERQTPEMEERIMGIIRAAAPEAADVHHLHVHQYGEHLELTVHICFAPQMSIDEAHAIAGRVKHALADALRVETTIHIEPLPSAPGQKSVDTPGDGGLS